MKNFKIWEGEVGDGTYRIVATPDQTVVIEVRSMDAMNESSWQSLRNPMKTIEILTASLFDMRNIFEKEMEDIAEDLKYQMSDSDGIDPEEIVEQVDEELSNSDDSDILNQISIGTY